MFWIIWIYLSTFGSSLLFRQVLILLPFRLYLWMFLSMLFFPSIFRLYFSSLDSSLEISLVMLSMIWTVGHVIHVKCYMHACIFFFFLVSNPFWTSFIGKFVLSLVHCLLWQFASFLLRIAYDETSSASKDFILLSFHLDVDLTEL